MTNEDLADLIVARSNSLREHFDMKMTALQTHISGRPLSMESDMLDLRGDILRLREQVSAQAKIVEGR